MENHFWAPGKLRHHFGVHTSCVCQKKKISIYFSNYVIHFISNEVIRRIDEYSTTLVVEHISSDHSGNYTCIATNVAGTERFTVPVTVNVPPKWILQPKDSNVQAGDDISLHCQADGYPTPVVTWRKCFTERRDFM